MPSIATINTGSSSIKLNILSYDSSHTPRNIAAASISGLGQPKALLRTSDGDTDKELHDVDMISSATILFDWLAHHAPNDMAAMTHRFVHGGPHHSSTELITEQLQKDLTLLQPYDPEHTPAALQLVATAIERFPAIAQIACFDTAFFHSMPRVAQLLPLPREYESLGLRRYGFHGLSYTSLLSMLRTNYGDETADSKIIFAHLGSGASLAAVHHGQPVDTTMGFTPASGIMMSSRSGDLDPGIAWFLQQQAGIRPEAFNELVNSKAGLLGVSSLSADMYTLLQNELTDTRAKEAIELFCYQVKKAVGALGASMDGVETLVFSGGIGEQSAIIRTRICDGLQHLGIMIDTTKNAQGEACISSSDSRVTVYVMPTKESEVMASEAIRLIAQKEST